MDELPSKAKSFLAAAKGIHDAPADPATKARLQRVIESRLLTPPSALSSLGKAKLWFAIAATTGLAGWATWAGLQRPTIPAHSEKRATPTVIENAAPQTSASDSDVRPSTSALPASAPTSAVTVRHAAGANDQALLQEAKLLRSVSRLLAEHQLESALHGLHEHRARFPHPILREERDGLSALAQCMRKPATALDQATRFIAHYPRSILVSRIEAACRLTPPAQSNEEP